MGGTTSTQAGSTVSGGGGGGGAGGTVISGGGGVGGASSTSSALDPLPYLASDLSKHIVESVLPPGSGRMMRGYRIRASDDCGGALLVCKATVIKLDPPEVFTGSGGFVGSVGEGDSGTDADAMRHHGSKKKSQHRMVRDEIARQSEELSRLRSLLSKSDHVLPYQRWIVGSSTAAPRDRSGVTYQPLYVLRQHFFSTLSDRLATRPFLMKVEKLWITYQILRALSSLHELGICHGHLTTENICLTSWNWVMLTDLASFKPTVIAGDDPSDFIYHFQCQNEHGGSDKRCYLAPERFRSSLSTTTSSSSSSDPKLVLGDDYHPSMAHAVSAVRSKTENEAVFPTGALKDNMLSDSGTLALTPEMDVFSAGCVLVETFLNGERAMDLADLMEYKSRGKSDALEQRLKKIDSSSIRAACRHMLSLDPGTRLGAKTYLERLMIPRPGAGGEKNSSGDTVGACGRERFPSSRDATIPGNFETFLWPLYRQLRCRVLSPDARIALAAAKYADAVRIVGGLSDEEVGDDAQYFATVLGRTANELSRGAMSGGRDISPNVKEDDDRRKRNDGEGKDRHCEIERTTTAPVAFCEPPFMSAGADDALLAETRELLRRIESLGEDEDTGGGGTSVKGWMLESGADTAASTTSRSNEDGSFGGKTHQHLLPPAMHSEAGKDVGLSANAAAATNSVRSSPQASSLILFLQLVLSSLRHVQRPPSKLVSLQLLRRMGRIVDDETRLQRIVPSAVSLLDDSDAVVRADALRTLADVLSGVETFSPSDAQLFPQYVFKRIGPLVNDDRLVVRVAFAECLASLAETSNRFLDVVHAAKLYETVVGGGGSAGGSGGGKEKDIKEHATSAFPEEVAKLLDTAAAADSGGSAGRTTTHSASPTRSPLPSSVDGSRRSSFSGGGAVGVEKTKKAPEASIQSPVVSNTLFPNTYDSDLSALQETVASWVVQVTTDYSTERSSSSPCKRALLSDLARLCSFFGRDGVTAQILPQLLAFLNNRSDWELRAALCRHLPAACAVVGRVATEQFVVPCVETALVDGEEGVVAAALTCLGSLVAMGLLTRSVLIGGRNDTKVSGSGSGSGSGSCSNKEKEGKIVESAGLSPPSPPLSRDGEGILAKYSSILLHPSRAVRQGITSLICATCQAAGSPDDRVFVLPLLRPFLQYEPSPSQMRDEQALQSCLLPPVSRKSMNDELRRLVEIRTPGVIDRSLDDGEVDDEVWTSVGDRIGDGKDVAIADAGVEEVVADAERRTNLPGCTAEVAGESVFGDLLKDLVLDSAACASGTDANEASSVTNAEAGSSLVFFSSAAAVPDGTGERGRGLTTIAATPSGSDVHNRSESISASLSSASVEHRVCFEKKSIQGDDFKEARSDLDAMSDQEHERARLDCMRSYLVMASHHRQQGGSGSGSGNKGCRALDSESCGILSLSANMMVGDTSLSAVPNMSAAHTIVTPSQKCAELLAEPLPEWYEAFREKVTADKASRPPGVSECTAEAMSVLHSSSSVARVYGVDVVLAHPSASSAQGTRRKLKGDAAAAAASTYNGDEDAVMGLEISNKFSSADARRTLLGSEETQTMEATNGGEWGSAARLDPALVDVSLTVNKLRCLDVPPLPSRLGLLRGTDGRPFSWHGVGQAEPPQSSSTQEEASYSSRALAARGEWRPGHDALVLSSSPVTEHSAAVTRLAVSQDQAFFVSSSHDGTCRVWELRQVEDAVDLRSSVAYCGHMGEERNSASGVPNGGRRRRVRVNDVTILENSHSVATAASNGSVHVWRVDMTTSGGGNRHFYENSRVSGTAMVRNIDPLEGEILSVSHFNTNSSSVVALATEMGHIHSWDVRCAREPFSLDLRPELGYLTSMAVGVDRNWIVAGTNRGYLALWDLRFQLMVKLWRHSGHSPVSRVATCFTTLPHDRDGRNGYGTEPRPYVFAGCGRNEASVFDLSTGSCRQCFRTLDPALGHTYQAALPQSCLSLPSLDEVKLPRNDRRPIYPAMDIAAPSVLERRATANSEPKVLSLMGRIGPSGNQYLITGGSDRCIRYWDFASPSRCATVSGLVHGQPRPLYESVSQVRTSSSQLFLCRQIPVQKTSEVEHNGRTPWKLGRGPVRPDNSHNDSILDLKNVDYPVRGLLSCSRDGVIKLWR